MLNLYWNRVCLHGIPRNKRILAVCCPDVGLGFLLMGELVRTLFATCSLLLHSHSVHVFDKLTLFILSSTNTKLDKTCWNKYSQGTHTLRGGGGRRSVLLCDKGGGILNFVTSHLKNSIKVTLHVLVSTKLKQFQWKALNIPQWTTSPIYT